MADEIVTCIHCDGDVRECGGRTYIAYYYCVDCDDSWSGEWCCACNDKCAGCHREIEPEEFEEVTVCNLS